MSASHPEVVVDHVSNLPSSEVANILLGLLLFNEDPPFEGEVGNDSPQCFSGLLINICKVL